MKENFNYIVDITKPPIGPPCRTIRDGFFSPKETKVSIEQTKRWKVYIEEYTIALKKGS